MGGGFGRQAPASSLALAAACACLTTTAWGSLAADPCDPDPCGSQARCEPRQDDSGGYDCLCSSGSGESVCQAPPDRCAGVRCDNGGVCQELADSVRCDCPTGYSGPRCENLEYWTLQQWKGPKCEGVPWRCFRLQRDLCVDTGFVDGNFPNRDSWYGRLTYDESIKGWSVGLCWGSKIGDRKGDVVPDAWCECEHFYSDMPRLGRNSLGPATEGRAEPDSDLCHKMKNYTSSRLVLSTGAKEGSKVTNRDCTGGCSRIRALRGLLVLLAGFHAVALHGGHAQ